MSRFVLSAFGDEIADDLKTQMDVLERNGIMYIEMRGVNGKPLVNHSLDEVREIKRQLDGRGFKISAVGSPLGKIKITDGFGTHVDLFRHTVEIAEILETEFIRLFSFYMPEGVDPSTCRDEVMKRMKEFVRLSAGTGLALLHENERFIYGDTPERCLDIFETMNCNYLKATFDAANFIACDVQAYPGAYEMLKDYIVYLHVKDISYSDKKIVPAGKGDARFGEIFLSLHSRGFDGFVSIEPHLGDENGIGRTRLFEIAANAVKKLLYEVTGEKRFDTGCC